MSRDRRMARGAAAVCAAAACGLALVLAVCVAGCRTAGAPEGPRVRYVVLVGVDGFGAQWIPWDRMPNLRRLRDEGLYAVGRDNYPTSSGINWATVMFGTPVELHGYRKWNSRKPDVPAFEVTERGMPPCVFHEIRRQDPAAYTVSLYNWDGIGFVHATNEVDFVRYFGKEAGTLEQRDDATMATAIEQLKTRRPALTYVYQHLPDCAGHAHGWGTLEFTNACVNVDRNLGRLVQGLEEGGLRDDTVILLVADHGGLGKRHGMDVLECFEVPFLVSGPAVRRGFRLREPVILADTAPTVLALLGYAVPETWRGRPALRPRD